MMTFAYKEIQIIKGMLARGDKQHDIAAFFGVNGGRIAEVSTGDCAYPSAPPLPENQLPPKGPYPSPYACQKAKQALGNLAKEIANTDEDRLREKAVAGIREVLKKLQ